MKILVMDKDDLTNKLIVSKLSAAGHTVVAESNKNNALELFKKEGFDCVMLDPAPLSEPAPIVFSIWNNVNKDIKPYIILLTKSEDMTTNKAILSKTNDFLLKPLNMEDIEEKVSNAKRFLDVFRFMAEEGETENLKGIINKQAFYQLFLSALDRAFRYSERSLIVFINISNFDKIKNSVSKEELAEFHCKIAEKMALMRRQSDVVGCIGESDYSILLQRPQYETEPLDAIARFSDELDKFVKSFKVGGIEVNFDLDLIEIPQGVLHSKKVIPKVKDSE